MCPLYSVVFFGKKKIVVDYANFSYTNQYCNEMNQILCVTYMYWQETNEMNNDNETIYLQTTTCKFNFFKIFTGALIHCIFFHHIKKNKIALIFNIISINIV